MFFLLMRISIPQFSISNITSVSALVGFDFVMNGIHVSVKFSFLNKTLPAYRTLVLLQTVVHMGCFDVRVHVQDRHPTYFTGSLSRVIYFS